jgi:hypothetical protein
MRELIGTYDVVENLCIANPLLLGLEQSSTSLVAASPIARDLAKLRAS